METQRAPADASTAERSCPHFFASLFCSARHKLGLLRHRRLWGFVEESGEEGFHGLGPEAGAFGTGVKPVGHEIFFDFAIGFEIDGVYVAKENVLVIGELHCDGGGCIQHGPMFGGAGAAVGSGKAAQQEDFGLGAFFSHDFDDALDASGNLLAGVMRGVVFRIGIVGADHQRDDLRALACQFSVLQIPNDVLGARAAVSEVDRLARSKIMIPHGLECGLLKIVRDGITDHDQVKFFLRD